jgi:hypothetical protein
LPYTPARMAEQYLTAYRRLLASAARSEVHD